MWTWEDTETFCTFLLNILKKPLASSCFPIQVFRSWIILKSDENVSSQTQILRSGKQRAHSFIVHHYFHPSVQLLLISRDYQQYDENVYANKHTLQTVDIFLIKLFLAILYTVLRKYFKPYCWIIRTSVTTSAHTSWNFRRCDGLILPFLI